MTLETRSTAVCDRCRRHFSPRRIDTRFCSAACRQAAYRLRLDAANLARSALGVSPDAWRDAQEAMGQGDAAIAVAAMLERSGEITSAGGYLRALTAKARAGEFSTGPLVMAQMKRNAAA